MYERCPKCRHHPLPRDQALPAACPACGVILAKVGQAALPGPAARRAAGRRDRDSEVGSIDLDDVRETLAERLFHVPDRVDVTRWWSRVALLAGFAAWGLWLIACDYRDGEIGRSFIHGPLLIFHEAGHVIFMPLGRWMMFLGGTLGQLLMPTVLGLALLLKNRDPFGAAIGLWLLGVSVLDVAPYVYDAWAPQLTLLGGGTGEDGGHDWIYLLGSLGLLKKAQLLGALIHKLGALTVLLALAWAGRVLWLQRDRLAGDVFEDL